MGMPRTIASLIAAAIAAFGVTFAAFGTGSALAPEPAKLSAALPASAGRTGDAVYLNSGTPTRVLFYSSSWISDSHGPAAGTPCSTIALALDRVTTQVIQRNAAYARCY